MDFRVEFKDSFLDDLERILRRIAARNPAAARTLGTTGPSLGERKTR
jgi:hypothetical protein